MMGPPAPYFCIQCGTSAPQVYKTYASGNLVKLLPCEKCGQLIDKYVEYDDIIVAINLVLQNPMAYRHVLLNSPFEVYWKLGVVFLFIEAYCYWCFQKGVEYETTSSDFYELEINFYRVLLRTLFSSALFHFILYLTCYIRFKLFRETIPPQFSYLNITKGICLSSFTVLFELIALIWNYSQDQNKIWFVQVLFTSTNAHCFYVTTNVSRIKSIILMWTTFVFRKILLDIYDDAVSNLQI